MADRISTLYVTVPSYFDLEISLIRELDKLVDLTVIILISPRSTQSSALEIDELPPVSGLYPASEIAGMTKYNGLIPLNNLYLCALSNNSFSQIKLIYSKINQFLKYKSFDLIHGTSLGSFATTIYPCFHKIKHRLLTLHDPIPHDNLSLKNRLIHESIISWFHNILLLNTSQAEAFIKRVHFCKPKLFFSRLGVYDYLMNLPDKPYETVKNDKYLLFIGRIEPYKGVDNLIRAFELSEAIKKGFKLVIAGKGKINENVYDKEGIVCINKYIPNDLLSGLIKNAVFVILPYQSATQSGVVMSCYACETPVLVTPVGDLPHAVKYLNEDEALGYVCKGITDTDIVDGINYMVENPDILQCYRNNIKKAISPTGNLSWNRITSEIKGIYEEILNKK